MLTANLFDHPPQTQHAQTRLAEDAYLLHGLARQNSGELLDAIQQVLEQAPLRHMMTPGGHTMSAAMSNCGQVGWVTDRKGYRYTALDPYRDRPWPVMPQVLLDMAVSAAAQAGFENFRPDACLINSYVPGARMALHQDRNERDFNAPVISVSFGLPVQFLFGGSKRSDKVQRHLLEHGDVMVWGGASRLYFHGVAPLKDGDHAILGARRINLTFRKAL